MLGTGLGGEDLFHHPRGCAAVFGGPANQPLRRPLNIFLMGFGHVLGNSSVAPIKTRSSVAGHPAAFVERFHGGPSNANIELAFDKLIGYRIIVSLHFDEWLPSIAPQMCFRTGVKEVEAWLIADRERLADFLRIPVSNVPMAPDSIEDPKIALGNRSPHFFYLVHIHRIK
jgi:hypothetical protein